MRRDSGGLDWDRHPLIRYVKLIGVPRGDA
jgi:hypothetical protein